MNARMLSLLPIWLLLSFISFETVGQQTITSNNINDDLIGSSMNGQFTNDEVSAQVLSGLELKLKLIEPNRWGVYARPNQLLDLGETITGSGAVTIVTPLDFEYYNLISVHGLWQQFSTVEGPSENPNNKYISFGLLLAEPTNPIPYEYGMETLLFTFDYNGCPDFLQLIDCSTDPFCIIGNTENANPDSDLSVIELGGGVPNFLNYIGNYGLHAWDCNDSDGDGVANALEDTNGNGIYDGNDASDLNNPSSGVEQDGLIFKLQLVDANTWGVFVTPRNVYPDETTITGSGQVTLVASLDFAWGDLESISGKWNVNSLIISPVEDTSHQYISFGLLEAEPNHPIVYENGVETLLFKFSRFGDCPTDLHLSDCFTPNSEELYCGIGNDLSVIQFSSPITYYNYVDNYAPYAWDCNDNDGDGFANGLEDSNGNGVYDSTDISNLNDAGSIIGPDGLITKIQLLATNKWGVFVTPRNVFPDTNTITGSGQITVVMPAGYQWYNSESINGLWQVNASVIGPVENPSRQYVSWALVQAEPTYPIRYTSGEETLLFTFEGENCPDSMFLIDCGTPNSSDPFCPINSVNSNPGCDLSVVQFSSPIAYYNHVDHYAYSAWSCQDCDQDGIPNALEDSNGNGTYDPGIDASDLCQVCEIDGLAAVLTPLNQENIICPYSTADVQVPFVVAISQGEGPYKLILDMGTHLDTVYHYYQGDTIQVVFDEGLAGAHSVLGSPVSGTYTLEALVDEDGCQAVDSLLSGSLQVEVEGPIVFTQQPQDVITCSGQAMMLTASAELSVGSSLTYEWMESSDGGQNWAIISDTTANGAYSGFQTNQLLIADNSELYGHCYRLAAKSTACSVVYSSMACVEIQGPITIVEQPQDIVSICANESYACFNVGIASNSPDFPDWSYIQYDWEESLDGGVTWMELDNGLSTSGGSGVNGAHTDTLCVFSPDERIGSLFRVKIFSNYCDVIYSSPVEIQGVESIEIVEQPTDQTVCEGAVASFAVEALLHISGNTGTTTGALNYQWMESLDGGLSYYSLTDVTDGVEGADTDELIILETTGRLGHVFQLKMWSNHCDTVYSSPVSINAQTGSDLILEQSPQDFIGCEDSDALFLVEFESLNDPAGIYTFVQWEIKMPGSNNWDLATNGDTFNGINIFGGANADTLLITPLTGLHEAMVRAHVWVDSCAQFYSDPATIYLEEPIVALQIPINEVWCSDESICLEAEVTNANTNGSTDFQWVYSENGIDWFPVAEGGVYSGTTNTTLCISEITGLEEYQYRFRARTLPCGWQYSQPGQIPVAEEITVIASPADTLLCEGEAHEFIAQATLPQGSVDILNYQWETSTDDGQSWSTITEGTVTAAGGIYSGVETAVLSISLIDGQEGILHRCQISSSQCSKHTDAAKISIDELVNCFQDGPEVTLGIRLMPNKTTWAVTMKPANGFAPLGYCTLEEAEVTIVVSQGFTYKNLFSQAGGTWKPGAVLYDTPDQLGLSYYSFKLVPGSNSFALDPNGVTLFTFQKNDFCPDSIGLMTDDIPVGLHTNSIVGMDTGTSPDAPFFLGGYHENLTNGCIGIIIGEGPDMDDPDGLLAKDPAFVADKAPMEQQKSIATQKFEVYPNPAKDWVQVTVPVYESQATVQLRLVNLHGQTVVQQPISGSQVDRLDTSAVPTGIYYLYLEVDGSIKDREKLLIFD